MLKRLKTVACVTICIVLLAPAVVGNYRFARHFLLHLNHPADPFSDISKQMSPVARPAVLLAGGHGRDEAMYGRFARAVGVSDGRRAIPNTNESLIDISYVTKANPNPQPWDVLLGRDVNYLSYGYAGTDDRYHQITYYWGESDSTPSPLVRKVRSNQTGAGKYFVRYVVYLSKDLKDRPASIEAGGRVLQWQAPRYPNIDRIDWSAYEGGGYNGFDELAFSIYATAAEGVTLFMLILWRGRR